MRRIIAVAAAVSAVAMACAAGTAGFDANTEAGAPFEGGVSASEAGGSTEAGVVMEADGAARDDAETELADGPPVDANVTGDASSSSDAGSSDAGAVADTSVSPTLTGSCDPAQWLVTASASAPNNPPAFAVDGLPPTRWSTGAGQAVGQYLQIDFGGFVFVDQIVLDDSFASAEEGDYPRGVEILGSSDGINFSTTLTTANFSTDPGAVVTIGFPQSTTRALRIQITTGVPSIWWAVHELRVDCRPLEADGGEGPPEPDAGDAATPSCTATDAGWPSGSSISQAGWTATASSVDSNDTIQGAIDGNSTTRWSSGQAQAGGEWFKVNLGQPTSLSGVSLYLLDGNVTDYPSSYALQLSNDDLTYVTVATGLGGVTTPICVPRQSAQYVMLTQTGTGDPSWWSIYELNVFP